VDEVGATRNVFAHPLRFEPFAQEQRVVRLFLLRQFEDRPEDQLVIAPVEVLRLQDVCHFRQSRRRDHQAAEDRLLGFRRLRRNAQLLDPVVGAIAVEVVWSEAIGAHAARSASCARSASRSRFIWTPAVVRSH
jgi:hypothetical protein